MAAGLVATADCRHQDTLCTALLDQPTQEKLKCPSGLHEAAVRTVSALLALEAEEGLDQVEGCSRHRVSTCLAGAAGS